MKVNHWLLYVVFSAEPRVSADCGMLILSILLISQVPLSRLETWPAAAANPWQRRAHLFLAGGGLSKARGLLNGAHAIVWQRLAHFCVSVRRCAPYPPRRLTISLFEGLYEVPGGLKAYLNGDLDQRSLGLQEQRPRAMQPQRHIGLSG